MNAKQRDGPLGLMKKMLGAFLLGVLTDIAVGLIFLGLGVLLFGPVTPGIIEKAVYMLLIGCFCLLVNVLILVVKAIIIGRRNNK